MLNTEAIALAARLAGITIFMFIDCNDNNTIQLRTNLYHYQKLYMSSAYLIISFKRCTACGPILVDGFKVVNSPVLIPRHTHLNIIITYIPLNSQINSNPDAQKKI